MTGNPNQLRLASGIRATLRALRGRIRRYVWMQGLAASVAWLGVAFWASLGIDRFFEPPVFVRGAVLAIAGLVLCRVWFRLILRRAFVRLTDANMAMLLERYFPQFNDSLLTAVELTRHGGRASECNPELLARTCRRAVEPIHDVRLSRVFNPVPLRLSVIAGVLFATTMGLFGALFPETFNLWTRRNLLLSDELWPRKTRLMMEGFDDGVTKVARGGDLAVIVKADLAMPVVPKSVQVRYRTAGAARLTGTMSREGLVDPARDEFQQYAYTFHGVLGPIEFDVVGGDAVLRDLRIEVVDSPTIVETVLDCRFPEYMHRAQRTLPATGVMPIPRGTRLTVRARANKRLVRVQVDSGGKTQYVENKQMKQLGGLIEGQRILRRRTAAGDDPRTLATEQNVLVYNAELLAGQIRAGLEAGRDGVGDAPHAGVRRLGAAVKRMRAAHRGLESDRSVAEGSSVVKMQEEALEELQRAKTGLAGVLSFRAFRYTLQPFTEDKTLLFTLWDIDGIKSREPVQLVLAVLDDEPPQLAVQLRGIGSAITTGARLPTVGRITDDYGIEKIWFEYAVDQKTSGSRPLESPPGDATDVAIDHALEVRDLDLVPGQKLLVTMQAADRYDLAGRANVGASDRWLLDVVTPEQLRTMLEARELVLRQRFESIIEEVQATRDSLARIDFGAPHGGEAGRDETPSADKEDGKPAAGAEPGDRPTGPEKDASRRRLAVRALRVQRALQNSQKDAHETQGVARAFDDIREELINNRVYTEELRIRIEDNIVRPLERIVEEMFPELDRRLNRLETTLADEKLGPENRDRARQQLDFLLGAMRQVLDRMVELEDFNEAVQLLRSIIRSQEKLRQQTEQRQKQKLRELLEN